MSAATMSKSSMDMKAKSSSTRQILTNQGVWKAYCVAAALSVSVVILAYFSDQIAGVVDQPIEHFEVSSSFNELSKHDVSNVLEPLIGQSFFSIDIQQIQKELEALAWVESAVIHRKWPSAVGVQIQEQIAVANWGHESYLNSKGEVFTPSTTERADGRPLFTGPESASLRTRTEMLTYMTDIESKLMAWGLSADQLVLNERGAWSLGLANGPVIELGTDTTESRLERALKVYQGLQADARAAVERLDARYTNGVSVRWKELEVASGYQYSGNPVHQ